MKTRGVFVHGYELRSENFDEVMWGTPPDRPGRLPKGIAVFLEQRTNHLVLGSGTTKGSEAQVITEHLFVRFNELQGFSCLNSLIPKHSESEISLKIEQSLCCVKSCKNTQEEIEEVGELFEGLGVTQWTLVSSSDHVSRIAKIAASLSWQKASTPPWDNISVAWSPISYGKGPDNVVVLEAPHGVGEDYTSFKSTAGEIANMLRLGNAQEARRLMNCFLEKMEQD